MDHFYSLLRRHCETVAHNACPHHYYSKSTEFTDILFDIIDTKDFRHITSTKHLCYDCSLIMLYKTKYFQDFDIFVDHVPLQNVMNESDDIDLKLCCTEFLRYSRSRDLIRVFLAAINYPQIMNVFYRNKTLFCRFVKILYYATKYLSQINENNLLPKFITNSLKVLIGIQGNRESMNSLNIVGIHGNVKNYESDVNVLLTEFETLRNEIIYPLHHHLNIFLYQIESPKYLLWLISIDNMEFITDAILVNFATNIKNDYSGTFDVRKNCALNNFDEFRKNPLLFVSINVAIKLFLNRSNKKIQNYLHRQDQCGLDETMRMVEVIKATMTLYDGDQQNAEYMAQNEIIFYIHKLISMLNNGCSNRKCNKKYLDYKYGRKINMNSIANCKENWNIVNKWKICSGCKIYYYCSRKCQKIDWKIGEHGIICKKLKIKKSWLKYSEEHTVWINYLKTLFP